MTSTPELIAVLTTNLTPVRRLRSPLMRASCWLLLAVLIISLLAVVHGARPNLVERLADTRLIFAVAGSLTTGILATIAAFMASLPDRSRGWLLLPVPALVGWLSTIGYQCLTNWVALTPEGMQLGETARCFATLVLTSLPLSLAMLAMLRHVVALRPTGVILLGSLAVAGITSTALSLLHPLDATVMVLAFNLGTALLMIAIGGVLSLRLRARSVGQAA